MNQILAFKLKTGEDLIGEVVGEDLDQASWTVKAPAIITLRPGPSGQVAIGLIPIATFIEQSKTKTLEIKIKKDDVWVAYEPVKEILNSYNQVYGAGLVLPL